MPVPPPVIRTGRPSNVVMPCLRVVVEVRAVVREHVLGERRDGRRGVTQRVAEALRRARERDAVEHVPDCAGERVGRIAGPAAEARRQLRAALLQILRARAESACGVAELVDVARAGDAQAVVVDGRCQRRLPGRVERGSQLGALVAGQAERPVDGRGDLGRLGHERGLLGRLAECGEHRRLLHAARVGEREPARVDGDPAELRHVVGILVLVVRRRPERAQEHEPVLERIRHEDAHDLLAGGGERLRGRRGREQLILARHGRSVEAWNRTGTTPCALSGTIDSWQLRDLPLRKARARAPTCSSRWSSGASSYSSRPAVRRRSPSASRSATPTCTTRVTCWRVAARPSLPNASSSRALNFS